MTEAKSKILLCPHCGAETSHTVEETEGSVMNTCSQCGQGHGYMTFGIDPNFGQMFTEMVRQRAWWECERDKAKLMLLESLKGITGKQADDIIDGRMKLVTVNRGTVESVEDNWTPPYEEMETARAYIEETLLFCKVHTESFNEEKSCFQTVNWAWADMLPKGDKLFLMNESDAIRDLMKRNIWEAKSRAYTLRKVAHDMMIANSGDFKEKRQRAKDREKEERSDTIRGSVLDRVYDGAKQMIENSDLDPEMKERMIRINEGQKQRMKEGETKIVPDAHYDFDTGWLDRNGIYYGCEVGQHINLAQELAKRFVNPKTKNGERDLEVAGWVKCSDKRWYYAPDDDLPLNELQCKVLEEWAEVWAKDGKIKWNGIMLNVYEVTASKGDVQRW